MLGKVTGDVEGGVRRGTGTVDGETVRSAMPAVVAKLVERRGEMGIADHWFIEVDGVVTLRAKRVLKVIPGPALDGVATNTANSD